MTVFAGSEPFAHFCRIMNNIFDVLNSRNFLSQELYKKPLTLEHEHSLNEFIHSSINYLCTLKDKSGNLRNDSRRKTGFLGLIISLTSARILFDELVKKTWNFYTHISFVKITTKPTPKQFEGSFKRILVHTELVSLETANCLVLDNTRILTVSSKLNLSNTSEVLIQDDKEVAINNNEIMEALNFMSNTLYLSDVIKYIGGFICRKLILKIKCEICCQSLTSDQSFSRLLNRKNWGGLCKASKDAVKICFTGERFLKTVNILQYTVSKLVLMSLRHLKHNALFRGLDSHLYE